MVSECRYMAQAQLSLAITSVGQTAPGADLTVILRL